jgi:hypothetical protein
MKNTTSQTRKIKRKIFHHNKVLFIIIVDINYCYNPSWNLLVTFCCCSAEEKNQGAFARSIENRQEWQTSVGICL